MKEAKDVVEFMTPRETAKKLGIATETLRKYANLFDKVAERDYFKRDNQNGRIYSHDDITHLKRVIKLKESAGETLENAVVKILTQESITDATPTVSESNNALLADVTAFQQLVLMQNNLLTEYKGLTDQMIESNEQLQGEIKDLLATQQKQMEDFQQKQAEREEKFAEQLEQLKQENEKKGFFSRIFKK